MSVVTGSFAAVLYLAAGGLLGTRLFYPERRWAKATPLLLVVPGLLVHGAHLAPKLFVDSGVDLSFFNVLSLAGWFIVALLIAPIALRSAELLGIAVLPASAVIVLLGIAFPAAPVMMDSQAGWSLVVHVALSVCAYALLTLAAIQSVALAIADRQLRRHSPGGFMRKLPPLNALEAQLFMLIGIGFIALSLALLSGFLFLEDIFAQHLIHKTVLSILAWLLFALLLWGRWRYGWRGRTAVRWTLIAFITLLLAYFGSELVLQLILKRR